MVQAKCLTDWCLTARKRLLFRFASESKKLVTKCELFILIAEKFKEFPWKEKSDVILGYHQHTSVSEGYFWETSYSPLALTTLSPRIIREDGKTSVKFFKTVSPSASTPLEISNVVNDKINERGKIKNIFQCKQNKEKKDINNIWKCGSICAVKKVDSAKRLLNIVLRLSLANQPRDMVLLLRKMHECQSICKFSLRRGHSLACRLSDGNGAPLVLLENLMPHFPQVRTLVRKINLLIKLLRDIDALDYALYNRDLLTLQEIADNIKVAGGEFKAGDLEFRNETDLVKKYSTCHKAYEKRMKNLPVNYCFCCERLLPRDALTDITSKRAIVPETGEWKKVYKHAKEKKLSLEFVCKYCREKLVSNQMPPIATMNRMEIPEVPAVIQKLNQFERMLCQRAKVFQVVVKAGTVMGNKNRPSSHLVSKVKGRSFHLPLPLEQTLNRILPPEQAIMADQELYILVRGLPTQNRKIWEHLLNMTDVLDALQWYQKNNPLYAGIKLPASASVLLDQLRNDDPEDADAPDESLKASDPDDPDEVDTSTSTDNDTDSADSDSDGSSSSDGEPVSKRQKAMRDAPNEPTEQIRNTDEPSSPITERKGNVPNSSSSRVNDREEPDDLAAPERIQAFVQDLKDPAEDPNEQAPVNAEATPELALERLRAMLTQRDADDEFYEDYTICPVYKCRDNALNTDLYQTIKIQSDCLDSRAKQLDAMCFPDLFPDGHNYLHEERPVKVQFADFVHAKMLSRHSRFRKNMQYLFFLMNQQTYRQIAAGIFQVLNVSRKKLTAAQFLKSIESGELERDLTSIFSRTVNTAEYWKTPRSQIYCMADSYGPATWFLTLSPAEYDDEELRAFMYRVNHVPPSRKPNLSALIAADPVSVCRFFEMKRRAIFDYLTASNDGHGPLGNVIHYAWRREYQGRGTQHYHTLLWIKDAPVLGVSPSNEVARFIQRYVTCRIPEEKSFPILRKKVLKYQQHRCNPYCKRSKGTKKGKVDVCRFGFPRPVTEEFLLRDVATSIAGRRNLKKNSRLYDLPRGEAEERINDYNIGLMKVWNGNIDIQYIAETSGALVRYVTKYQTKPETSNMKDVFDDINNTKSVYSRLWNIAMRGMTNRECGALEGADNLLSYAPWGTDPNTTVKWLDVSQFRSRRLKSKKQIEALAADDTNLYADSIIDTHYPNRPNDMSDLCLHDYAKDWDIINDEPQRPGVVYYRYGEKFLRKRVTPHLINHYRYDMRQQPENYFHSLLLLFKPWRKPDDLKGSHATFAAAFAAEKESLQNAMQYHDKRVELDAALEVALKTIAEKNNEMVNEENQASGTASQEDPGGFRHREALDAMAEFRAAADEDSTENLSSLEAQLNPDQLRVYNYVKSRIWLPPDRLQRLTAEQLSAYNSARSEFTGEIPPEEPLRHFVSGVGGTGKSFLIHVITLWVKQNLKLDVALAAPTGIAAFAIDGQTLHRLLQLPVEHKGRLKYAALSDTVLGALRNALKDVAIFIIDEISMVSSIMFFFIHMRLFEIFAPSEEKAQDAFFGLMNMVVTGDLLQIPPVNGNPPFVALTSAEKKKHFASTMSNLNLWELFSYDELLINMRQMTDGKFCELLANIRLGICTDENLETLEERRIPLKAHKPEERLQELACYIYENPQIPVVLLPTNEMTNALNKAILAKLPTEEVFLFAEDVVTGGKPSAKAKALKTLKKLAEDESQTAGLPTLTVVKVGARVMLRKNIDVTKGYTNGATGTILSIKNGLDNTPISIRIQMKNDILELTRHDGKFEILPGVFVYRKQFPIIIAYAITIHKSQSLSLDACVIDIGNRIFCPGQSYVALSRVRTLNGTHIINIDPQKIQVLDSAVKEYQRLRSKTPHLKSIAAEIACDSKKKTKRIVQDKAWAPNKKCKVAATAFDNSPTPKKMGVRVLWPAFRNNDGVSSYANATLQCLLSWEPLRSSLRRSSGESALKTLATQFQLRNEVLLASDGLRKEMGTAYSGTAQHSASEFLLSLISRTEVLREATKYTLITEIKCDSCDYKMLDEEDRHVLPLPTNKSGKSIMQLLDSFVAWVKLTASTCESCGNGAYVQRYLISNTRKLLIVQFEMMRNKKDRKVKNTNFRINALPSTTLSVDSSRFKLHSAAFHHGSASDSGHNTAIVRNGKKFVLADDVHTIECKWPTGGKDADFLVYHRLESAAAARPQQSKPAAKSSRSKDGPPLKVHECNTVKETKIVRKKPWTRQDKSDTLQANPKIIDGSKIVAQVHSLFPRFSNDDNVSCYANASLQALLSCELLRSTVVEFEADSPLRRMASLYRSDRSLLLSSDEVRVTAGGTFADRTLQQDAPEFMMSIIQLYPSLQERTKHTVVSEKMCEVCGYQVCNRYDNYILSMTNVYNDKKIDRIIDNMASWSPLPGTECSQCKRGEYMERDRIIDSSHVFIVQTPLFAEGVERRGQVKSAEFQLEALEMTDLHIGEQSYSLHSAIFHKGDTILSGHYVAIIRSEDKFILTDDFKDPVECTWPNGSKDAYLLVYKKIGL